MSKNQDKQRSSNLNNSVDATKISSDSNSKDKDKNNNSRKK